MRPTILRALIAMMLAGIVVFGAAMGVSAQTQTLATFEAGHSFEAGDHVISLVASTDWASQGNRSLRVNHGPIPAGSRFVVRVAQDLNWVGATHVLADFYVPENAPHSYSAALMIQVGDGWTWYETNPVPLSPGENKDVAFRLDTAEWRTAATGWQPGATAPLTGLRAYGILVFSDLSEPGAVYIDNVRLVRPAAAEGAGEVAAGSGFAHEIRISGNAKLTVVSQPKEVPVGTVDRYAVSMNPASWEVEATGDHPEVETTTDMDGNTVQALVVSGVPSGTNVRVDIGGVDLSDYSEIHIDLKLLSGSTPLGMQFVLSSTPDWYYDTQHFPAAEPGEWVRFVLKPEQFFHPSLPGHPDLELVNSFAFRTFAADADFMIANVYFVGEAGETETVTEVSRTHEVNLFFDYEPSEQLSFRVGAKLLDPDVKLGLVEVKGSQGPLSLRAFHNGTASDLGDPLNLFRGSKYFENSTTGVDATLLVGSATAKAQYVRPSSNDKDENRVALGKVDLPIGTTASASAIVANQSNPGKDESFTTLGAAGKFSLGSVNVTTELASTLRDEDKNLAWMAEASVPVVEGINVTVHAREVGRNVAMAYNDHQYNGYGQRYMDVSWQILKDLSAGLYLQNWYNADRSYDALMHKLSLNAKVGSVNLAGYVETERTKSATGKYDALNHDRKSLKATAKLFNVFDVTGFLWNQKKKTGEVESSLVGRISFEPLADTTVSLEASRNRKDKGLDPTQNVYAKVARKIPGGELSLAYGKRTFNDDDNTIETWETAKDYFELKLEINF